jgi:putative chitobiose transport system substrate-binding protein
MNKKFLISIIVLITVVLSFFMLKTPQKDNNDVVLWTLQMGDFAPYMNKVISNFEKENPTIKIKWIDVPFSEGEKRTLASILSDNPPDLINLNPDFTNLLAQRGALYEINTPEIAQYNQEIVNSLKYNGKLYSLPWYATSAITIYNKSLVKKAGVSLPKTYEDIATISPQIKSKTGAYAQLPNITENDTMVKILNKYGVNSSDKINSPESIAVFDFYKNLYAKDLIPKETVTQTQREALEKYMAEKIVFFQAGANFLNMIKENAPSTYKNTDVAPQITGKLGQNDFSLMNFIIPQRAKHKSAALKFALYLTNAQNQLELAKLTNVIATNNKSLQDDFYTKYEPDDLMAKARVISAKQLNKINPVLRPDRNQKEVNTIINSAVQEILLGKTPTKRLLVELQKIGKA